MRLKRMEVKIEVGNEVFRYTYSNKHKEFTYKVKEGNYYTELSQLPKHVQDLFTRYMKLMQWKRVENCNDNITGLQLWMTLDGSNWYHYTNPLFSSYRKPEKHIDGIRTSTGFSTFQYCLKQGFKVVNLEGNLI